MIRNSIVAKLWLTIVAMVVLVLALLSILLQQFFDNYVYQQHATALIGTATRVQTLVEQKNLPFAEAVAAELAKVQNTRIQVAVPLSSSPALDAAYHGLTRTEQQLLADGQPVSVRLMTQGGPSVAVYMMVPAAPQPGLLVVRQRMSVLNQPMDNMRNLILFATALGIVLTTGLAFVVSKNLSRPLILMNDVAESMARGNFDWQINVVTNDEVGRLGHTFNALANELRSTIAALSMEKDQLRSILLSLQDGVIATAPGGAITLANPPAVRRMNSLQLSETGSPGTAILPPTMMKYLNEVVDRRTPVAGEIKSQGRYLALTMTPLFGSDGDTLRGAVGVLRDVTEERRLDRLRKDFIANVSHELRTPLSMMQGYTEALQDEFGDDPMQQRELIGIIHDETLRMRRLVNDLLDLAQLESGQFQMNFSTIDAVALVRRVGRKFNALAADRGVSFTVVHPDTPIFVMADPDRIEQVLTNLLDNAIRHTGPEGTVGIEVGTRDKYAKFRVTDTGSGIPDEDIPYIWERFYKADKARTRGNSGTGLGLSITRHIVVEHAGDIIVESDVGIGTAFTVAIPLAGAAGSTPVDT